MRSKASVRGHPIHPALIPFPFAFLNGGFFFYLAGHLTRRESWWTTGGYLDLAGIVAALVAAVPGFIDYLATVPPKSSGKERATKHMLVNLVAVVLFVVAWVIRGHAGVVPGVVELVLEAVGLGLLTAGGWMGGVLVSRNQISVDHRYARAGRWKEESFRATPDQPVVVAKSDELEPDQMKLLHVDGRRIVLARTANGYVAFDDRCTHKGGSLAGGVMIGGVVQCPWHGSQFDCRSGAVKAGPAKKEVDTYKVSVANGEVRLSLGGKAVKW
jgi:nitrite reductase/ring-hydroxylating ferredoxin subunit/uncharacterized membrane protein